METHAVPPTSLELRYAPDLIAHASLEEREQVNEDLSAEDSVIVQVMVDASRRLGQRLFVVRQVHVIKAPKGYRAHVWEIDDGMSYVLIEQVKGSKATSGRRMSSRKQIRRWITWRFEDRPISEVLLDVQRKAHHANQAELFANRQAA